MLTDLLLPVLGRDYLYGHFAPSRGEVTASSLFGAPLAYQVTKLLIEHNTLSAGLLYQVPFPLLDKSYPLEIEGYFTVNEKGQIDNFDISMPRWNWLMDTLSPLLLPHLAIASGLSNASETVALQRYLSSQICNATMSACSGENQVYDTIQDCMSAMTSAPLEDFNRVGANTVTCRAFHAPLLTLSPDAYCPNVSPSGGNMCIDRDYTETVQDTTTTEFIGPLVITPENERLLSRIALDNAHGLDPLVEIALSTQGLHSWDPTLFATFTFVVFLFLYFFAMGTEVLFLRFHKVYKGIPREHQRNVVMYAMNIIFTTIALVLQLVPTPGFAGNYQLSHVQCMRFAALLICILYIFELIFRYGHMRLPLIAHHFLTIFAISLTLTLFEYNQSSTYMLSAVIWLLQATTEQPTFLGLMGYRLKWPPALVADLLKIAAVQTFVFKIASSIALIVYWGVHQTFTDRPIDLAWSAFVWIISLGLMATQVWGSYLTYVIGIRVNQKNRLIQAGPDSAQSSSSDLNSHLSEFRNDVKRLYRPVYNVYSARTKRGEEKPSREAAPDNEEV
ncbi:hypothetical protein IAT40_005249 [Kwoniella sp. CBS 6097]